jgi:hypothetical protein
MFKLLFYWAMLAAVAAGQFGDAGMLPPSPIPCHGSTNWQCENTNTPYCTDGFCSVFQCSATSGRGCSRGFACSKHGVCVIGPSRGQPCATHLANDSCHNSFCRRRRCWQRTDKRRADGTKGRGKCFADADCGKRYCSGVASSYVAGYCFDKLADGVPCERNEMCASGLCANGVCAVATPPALHGFFFDEHSNVDTGDSYNDNAWSTSL